MKTDLRSTETDLESMRKGGKLCFDSGCWLIEWLGKGHETMFSNLAGECKDAIQCVLSRGVIEGMAALYLTRSSVSYFPAHILCLEVILKKKLFSS